MSEIERCLRANAEFASEFSYADLDAPPRRRLAVVCCMDARLLTLHEILGLQAGDAHVIRNAGGIVTEDALRSLLLSYHVLGAREILIINHTQCGLLGLRDKDVAERLTRKFGEPEAAPESFLGFDDLQENVRNQVARVREHPWIPDDTPVRGFVYDVATGRLGEVTEKD